MVLRAITRAVKLRKSLERLLDRLAITFRENLHGIERAAAVALLDLNRREGAIRTRDFRMVRRHGVEGAAAPFQRLLEIFLFHRPGAVVAGAFFHDLHSRIW